MKYLQIITVILNGIAIVLCIRAILDLKATQKRLNKSFDEYQDRLRKIGHE